MRLGPAIPACDICEDDGTFFWRAHHIYDTGSSELAFLVAVCSLLIGTYFICHSSSGLRLIGRSADVVVALVRQCVSGLPHAECCVWLPL